MSHKRTPSKGVRKNQKDLDEKRVQEAGARKTAPVEIHQYQCNGDFEEDFRQISRSAGLSYENIPKLVHKRSFSLWRNVEVLPPPLPLSSQQRSSESPNSDVPAKGGKEAAGKVEPGSKSSLMDSNGTSATKGKESKDKAKVDKGKKKGSKITGTSTKADNISTKAADQKPTNVESPKTVENCSETKDAPVVNKKIGTKGKELKDKDGKGKEEQSVAQSPTLPVTEGNDKKPLYIVYEPYTQNRLKEIALRCWTVDRQTLEVLYRCWMAADKLTSVILVDCGLKSTDVMQLSDVLPKIANIEFLALDGNFISEQNHGLVLAKSSSLRSFSVRYSNLDDKAMRNLAEAWGRTAREWTSDKPGLEFLDLSRNKITDKGLEYLVQVLRFNRSLTTLAIPGNQITDYGVELLCNCLFTRFLLTKNELLDRRSKRMLHFQPIVGANIYSLKKYFYHSNETESLQEKFRQDSDGSGSRKKDESRKTLRFSGAQISPGNAVKGSTRSPALLHQNKSETKTSQKHPSVVKASSRIVHPVVQEVESGKLEFPLQETTSHQDKGHAAPSSKITDPVDRDESSRSQLDRIRPSHLSMQEADKQEHGSTAAQTEALQHSTTSFTDMVLEDEHTTLDSRGIDLLHEIKKIDHSDWVLSDQGIWLDHHSESLNVCQNGAEIPLRQNFLDCMNELKIHKRLCADKGVKRQQDYQWILLNYCKQIVDGTANVWGLPEVVQSDLAKLCNDPYSVIGHLLNTPDSSKSAQEILKKGSLNLLPENQTAPKFELEITFASLTDLKKDRTLKNTSGASINPSSEVVNSEEPSDEPREGTQGIVDKTDVSATGSVISPEDLLLVVEKPKSPRTRTQNSAMPTTHRKVSLKKSKVKKGEGTEIIPLEPPKECPHFVVVTVEEKFNALFDGIIYEDGKRLISDGNRTLKVLNLMSNKLTTKSVYCFMEVVNKQREEQSVAALWSTPVEPEVAVSKTLIFPVSSSDALEFETGIRKKEPSVTTAKTEERIPNGKRSGGKKNAADFESVAPSAPVDDAVAEDCTSMIITKRVIKDIDDPNKQNVGLLYVDVDFNVNLTNKDKEYRIFEKFMAQQRESLGIIDKPTKSECDNRGSRVGGADKLDDPVATLKKLPINNPVQYSFLKGEYVAEKRKKNPM